MHGVPVATDLRSLWSQEQHPLDSDGGETDGEEVAPMNRRLPMVEQVDTDDDEEQPARFLQTVTPWDQRQEALDLPFAHRIADAPFEDDDDDDQHDLTFAPRLQDPDEDIAWMEPDDDEDDEFSPDKPPRIEPPSPSVDECFAGVKLFSTAYLDRPTSQPQSEEVQSNDTTQQPSLSNMIHSVDWQQLEEGASYRRFHVQEVNDDVSVSLSVQSSLAVKEYSAGPSRLTTQAMITPKAKQTKRNSSFRSSLHQGDRIVYKLGEGVKSMSKEQKKQSRALLPPKRPEPPKQSSPYNSPQRKDQSQLFVLLVDPPSKLFEIVTVNLLPETTVGDVLSKARAQATELSQPHYVSLCTTTGQDLAAPMLPLSCVDHASLVAAVPEGYAPSHIGQILVALSKHRRVQRFLERLDPTQRPTQRERRKWKEEKRARQQEEAMKVLERTTEQVVDDEVVLATQETVEEEPTTLAPRLECVAEEGMPQTPDRALAQSPPDHETTALVTPERASSSPAITPSNSTDEAENILLRHVDDDKKTYRHLEEKKGLTDATPTAGYLPVTPDAAAEEVGGGPLVPAGLAHVRSSWRSPYSPDRAEPGVTHYLPNATHGEAVHVIPTSPSATERSSADPTSPSSPITSIRSNWAQGKMGSKKNVQHFIPQAGAATNVSSNLNANCPCPRCTKRREKQQTALPVVQETER